MADTLKRGHPYDRLRNFLEENMGGLLSREGFSLEEVASDPSLNGGAGYVVLHAGDIDIDIALDRGQFIVGLGSAKTGGRLHPKYVWATILDREWRPPSFDGVAPLGHWKAEARWFADHFDEIDAYLNSNAVEAIGKDVLEAQEKMRIQRGW